MAFSIGANSDHVLRGVDRTIAAVVDVLPVRTTRPTSLPRAWLSQRGQEVLSCRVRVSGGFPGSIRAQHTLDSVVLAITDDWLIAGEGTPSGFALPVARLDGFSVQPCGGIQPPCLVVWYRDGVLSGSFQISFLGTSRNRHGEFRATPVARFLQQQGVPIVPADDARFVPDLFCPWSDIASFADDDVRYAGSVFASSGGPFGAHLDTARVWITDRWLLWCPTHGTGLNRLELDRIVECRSGYGDRLLIGIEDACGGRYDLYFDFGVDGDRTRPVLTVQDLLAAADIPIEIASTPIAPWRRSGTRPASEE